MGDQRGIENRDPGLISVTVIGENKGNGWRLHLRKRTVRVIGVLGRRDGRLCITAALRIVGGNVADGDKLIFCVVAVGNAGAVRVDEGGEEARGGAVKGVNLLITKRLLQLSHLIKKNQFPTIFIFP